MAQGTFSVAGRQVVVVGAARSGLAAAELLRRRGARVTLTESRPSFAESAALEAAGVRVETGGHHDHLTPGDGKGALCHGVTAASAW